MVTIVTRSGKGAPLTNAEVDANFTNLNNGKVDTAAPSAISVNSSSAALTVTQTGTGNALVVEDAASDTTPFIVTANGDVGIGTTTVTPVSNWRTLKFDSTNGGNMEFHVGGVLEAEIYTTSTGDLHIGTTASGDDLFLRTSGTVRMAIDDLGNVSIGAGTTTSSVTGYTVLMLDNAVNGGNIRFRNNGSTIASIFNQSTSLTITGETANTDIRIFASDTGSKGIIIDAPVGNVRIGEGVVSPDASAQLDVASTARGFLPPRMTTAQRDAISSPAAGLTIFNTTDGAQQVYNGLSWSSAGAAADAENRIINGTFDFWQRKTSTSTHLDYAADRWRNEFGGSTQTQSRQAFTVGDKLGANTPEFFMRIAAAGGAGAGDYCLTKHFIEDVRSYAGETITILGWAKRSAGAGDVAVSLTQFFGSGGSPSSAVTSTGQRVSLATGWTPFALTFAVPSITGKTIGTTENTSALILNIWASAGSTYAANTDSLGQQTVTVDLWGLHIRRGAHGAGAAGLYVAPEKGPELARCQRYYAKTYRQDVLPGTVTDLGALVSASVTGFACVTWRFPVEMRGVPSLVAYNPGTGGTGTWKDGSGSNRVTNGIFASASGAGLSSSTATANTSFYGHATADAEF